MNVIKCERATFRHFVEDGRQQYIYIYISDQLSRMITIVAQSAIVKSIIKIEFYLRGDIHLAWSKKSIFFLHFLGA